MHAVPFLMRVDQLQLGDGRALVDELLTSIAKVHGTCTYVEITMCSGTCSYCSYMILHVRIYMLSNYLLITG